MVKEKFTAPRIAAFTVPDGRKDAFYWDLTTRHFGVKVYESGERSFIFQAKIGGKTIRKTIGNAGAGGMSIEQARKEVTELANTINKGIDPRLEKKRRLAENEAEHALLKVKTLRVGEAWGAYIADNIERMNLAYIGHGKKWGARHLADHLNASKKGGEKKVRGSGLTTAGVLYPLLKLKMADISIPLLVKWQRTEAKERANKARQGYEMFRAFIRWCANHPEYKKVTDVSVVEASELRKEVPSRKSKRDSDSLDRVHLRLWFSCVLGLDTAVKVHVGGLRDQNNAVAKAYLQAVLLTGARREEMAQLRWSDISFERNYMWLKDKVEGGNKEAGEGREIPLTPYLKSVLQALPKRNEYVFSSESKTGYIAEPSSPHRRALDKARTIEADFPHVSIHGLRRTFCSLSDWAGDISAGAIAQIVGHRPSATAERHYRHRPLELLQVIHTKYEKWLLEQAGIEFDYGEVE